MLRILSRAVKVCPKRLERRTSLATKSEIPQQFTNNEISFTDANIHRVRINAEPQPVRKKAVRITNPHTCALTQTQLQPYTHT